MQVSLGREPTVPAPVPTASPRPPNLAANTSRAAPLAHDGLVETASSALPANLLATSVRERFEASFAALARDRGAFDELITQTFGEHDSDAAEMLRGRACVGDFSWLPRIEFCSSETLAGANGAYAAKSATVYLNRDRAGNVELLGDTFVEEVGHHLDTLLRTSDAKGDEGAIFRRTLLGERLDSTTVAALKNEDDHGAMVVRGRSVAVEFRSVPHRVDRTGNGLARPMRAVSSVVGSSRSAISGAVTSAARRAGACLVEATSAAGHGAWGLTATLGSGVWSITGGAIAALFSDGFAAAWDRFWGGVDAVLFRASAQGLSLLLDVTERLSESAERLLPESWLRSAIGNVRARVMDATRSLLMGSLGAVTGALRNSREAGSNLGRGADLVRCGETQRGLRQMLWAALELPQTVLDAALMAGGKVVSAAQTLAFLEPPGRRLNAVERQELGRIFGDALDLDQIRIKEGRAGLFSSSQRPFTHGNTIYMKNSVDRPETPGREFMHVLVSEATHAWQFQNGGTDYMSEALASQAFGKGYRWAADAGNTPWQRLEPEQQDAFLSYAELSGAFQATPPEFPKDTVVPKGMTLASLNAYLTASLAAIRERKGAP